MAAPPLQHARASQTAKACAVAKRWSREIRNSTASQQSNSCLAHGRGTWQPLSAGQTEPYLLSSTLEKALKREPRHWWGKCDHDLVMKASQRGASLLDRSPRASLLHEWMPEGDGCNGLLKGRPILPDLSALACSFCTRHAGRRVLFVGDSVQGEFFLAFSAILGIVNTQVNGGNEGCRRQARAHRPPYRAYSQAHARLFPQGRAERKWCQRT